MHKLPYKASDIPGHWSVGSGPYIQLYAPSYADTWYMNYGGVNWCEFASALPNILAENQNENSIKNNKSRYRFQTL